MLPKFYKSNEKWNKPEANPWRPMLMIIRISFNINLDYSNINYKFAFEFCRDQGTLIIYNKFLYIHISPFLNKVDKRHGILVAKIVFIFSMYLAIQYTIWLFNVQACQKNIGITETTGHHGNNENCKKKHVTALECFINRFRFHLFRRDASS